MKAIFLLSFICFSLSYSFTQQLDDMSKKELKEMCVQLKKKVDSLEMTIYTYKSMDIRKDSIIVSLNKLLLQTEQRLNEIEYETSSCKLSRDSLKTNLMYKETEVSRLYDSIQKSNAAKAVKTPSVDCTYKEEKLPDCDYPVMIKSCTFGNYKNIKSGEPDFKGNYSFSYDLFKKMNGKYVKINNSELFNSQKMDLLEKLNIQIKQNFEQFLSDPTNKECFDNAAAPFVPFDDMSIHVLNDRIEFIVKYSVAFSCFTDKGTVISYTFQELLPYLNL